MRTYTQLTHEQRYQIYSLLKEGLNQTEIANIIQVHKSTISRELRRNRGMKGYRPKQAHEFALRRHNKAKRLIDASAWAWIETLIHFDLSPEQVSDWLKNNFGLQNGSYDRRGKLKNRVSIDEVMIAWGRLSQQLNIDGWGVTPDIIATAKGITSGLIPLAATIASEEIWQAIEDTRVPFMAGHTMNQNPVAAAAGVANIDYIETHNLLDNVKNKAHTCLGDWKNYLSLILRMVLRGI
jgi:hypothetical protein